MNYNVSVNGQQVSIRQTKIFPSPYNEVVLQEYVQFTMNEPVDLRIESEEPLTNVIIRPLSLGLEYSYSEHEIHIHLKEAKKFSVEINDSFHNCLIVFAEPVEYEDFDPYAENVMYFGKGIHDVGILTVNQDNTVLYLEEGAFLNGKIDLDHCKHVMICGYGTVSMENYPLEVRSTYHRCVDVMHCQGVVIRDITITDSNDWSLRVFGCDNVTVDNVKIFGCRGNSDGIDICGSRNVLVQNIFTRVWDDSFVVKAFDTGDLENVIFRNSVLWNDFARPLEVGVELRADRVRNVHFENIDIIHSPTGYPLMGIHHGDRAEVSEIYFENIRIEVAPGAQLFDIRIADSVWNRDTRKGRIHDVFFKDIYYIGNPGIEILLSNSRLEGFSAEHDIQSVTFSNINILDKAAEDARGFGLNVMDHVSDVVVVCDENAKKINVIETEVTVTKPFALTDQGQYLGSVRVYFHNTSQERQETSYWLQVSPANTGEYRHEKQLLMLDAQQSTYSDYEILLPPGKYVLAIQSDDVNVRYAWTYVQVDWILRETSDLSMLPELEIANYYGDRTGGIKAAVCDGALYIQADLLKDQNNSLILYTAEPVERRDGEVVFSVEETDFGVVPAVICGRHGLEAAPQLRCPLEITLVFKNEPKVKEIHKLQIPGGGGDLIKIPMEKLGLKADTKHFWMEMEARTMEVEHYRYPHTLFHSVTPLTSAHMYANVIIQ